MNRIPHRLVGASSGAAFAFATHGPSWHLPAAVAVAACAAGGRLSPDADQYATWDVWRHPWRLYARALTAAVPPWRRQRGRHGDPTQHRGITHSWTVPLLWALLAAVAELVWPHPAWFLAWAAIIGWTSHLAGDLVHGRPYRSRGPGIPITGPWWGHHGLGLKSDGITAYLVTVPGCLAFVGWLAWSGIPR